MNKDVLEKRFFNTLGKHGTTQLQPIFERIECEERVCDHTGQCGGVGSGDVANLRIGDHSITMITILHSNNDTELKYK